MSLFIGFRNIHYFQDTHKTNRNVSNLTRPTTYFASGYAILIKNTSRVLLVLRKQRLEIGDGVHFKNTNAKSKVF